MKKAKPVVEVKVAPRKPKKVVNPLDQMTQAELKARRIQIAEEVLAAGVWIMTDGKPSNLLDQTEYHEVVRRINT